MRELNRLWNGEKSEVPLSYSLGEGPGELVFAVQFPDGVKCHPDARAGEFTSELWKWDAAEVFIVGEDGRYIEVNLAPNGAFWIQGFLGVRISDPDFAWRDLIQQSSAMHPILKLSMKGLSDYLGNPDSWRANVTGILNSPNYAYLSVIKLPGNEPDFHQPDSFSSYKEFLTS